jgi:hypothetical protein
MTVASTITELRLHNLLNRLSGVYNAMIQAESCSDETINFAEFRRKVQSAELLSAAIERLLWGLRFTGRLSVVVQNGQVLKSGYEEGYFRKMAPGFSARLQ